MLILYTNSKLSLHLPMNIYDSTCGLSILRDPHLLLIQLFSLRSNLSGFLDLTGMYKTGFGLGFHPRSLLSLDSSSDRCPRGSFLYFLHLSFQMLLSRGDLQAGHISILHSSQTSSVLQGTACLGLPCPLDSAGFSPKEAEIVG